MKHLTILICTHNRSNLLENALQSLNRAVRPPGLLIDILVVANACIDNTSVLLENYKKQAAGMDLLPLSWLEEPAPGKSHALNSALPKLHSDLVAFVDDDHRVDEGFTAGILDAAESYPKASMFCGRILPDWDGTEPAWVHDSGPYRIYPPPVPTQDFGEISRRVDQEGFMPGGGNIFLRREALDRIGEFRPELGPKGHNLAGGEDIEFVLRALKAGEELVYIPNIIQYHFVDPERLRLANLLRLSFQRSRAAAHTQNRYNKVPLFMWRKLLMYFFHFIRPLQWSGKRFYLMRIAATLGEIKGIHSISSD